MHFLSSKENVLGKEVRKEGYADSILWYKMTQ